MNLKLYTSVAKGLKLKVKKFLGLVRTFIEVTREKLVGGLFAPPPTLTILNRVNVNNATLATDLTEHSAKLCAERIQVLLQHHKKRFYHKYLAHLHERQLYKSNKYNNDCKAKVGDIVLIKEEGVLRMRWYKRRIGKLLRRNDSLVRGVELKVNLGKSGQTMTICRPLQLIIPFEL